MGFLSQYNVTKSVSNIKGDLIMKYFLDSAKMDEIKYAYENWAIDGVTTNPRHIAAAKKPFATIVKELAAEFKGVNFPISVEVNPHYDKPADMIAEAKTLAAISPNFCIKIPCTEPGLVAAKHLVKDGIKVNLTLVFTASQALQAGRIGVKYVSPFIGWSESSGMTDTEQLIDNIVTMYDNYGIESEIIVAAVRTGKQIVNSALSKAHIVTCGYDVYKESFLHPFTDKGLKMFCDFYDQTEKGTF